MSLRFLAESSPSASTSKGLLISVGKLFVDERAVQTELLSKVVDEDFSGGGLGFDSVGEFETLNYVG